MKEMSHVDLFGFDHKATYTRHIMLLKLDHYSQAQKVPLEDFFRALSHLIFIPEAVLVCLVENDSRF